MTWRVVIHIGHPLQVIRGERNQASLNWKVSALTTEKRLKGRAYWKPFTLVRMARAETTLRMLYQIPIPFWRFMTGRRRRLRNFLASVRSSNMLLSRANRGAIGKAGTNIVIKPYWITGNRADTLINLKMGQNGVEVYGLTHF